MRAAMQQRVSEVVGETEAKARGLRDASEKNVHFSARVVALNSRMQNLQKQLRESQAREQMLTADLAAARQDSAKQPAAAHPSLPNGELTPAVPEEPPQHGRRPPFREASELTHCRSCHKQTSTSERCRARLAPDVGYPSQTCLEWWLSQSARLCVWPDSARVTRP